MNNTRKKFFGLKGINLLIELDNYVATHIFIKNQKYKIRIVYGIKIYKISHKIYDINKIALEKIYLYSISNKFKYNYKYYNRSVFNNFISHSGLTDVIMVKNRKITDSTISNLVFCDKKGLLFTPLNCLLNGTQRQMLLDYKVIIPRIISIDDLKYYIYFKRINSMISLHESPKLDINIIYKHIFNI